MTTLSHAALREGTTIVRRLAAVAFADVVGFSKLVAQDDVAAMQDWKELRAILIEPKIEEHHGKTLRVVGDGMLIEFGSAVDAVRCCQEIQRGMAHLETEGRTRLRIRIGINVEDVIVDEGDLHGDGVNIAARIHQLASPGEVVVTAAVREYVWNKLGVKFTDLGERDLKNIARPVRVYRLEAPTFELAAAAPRAQPYLSWTRRPSIAVLPFRNLSGNPDEAYFGEGITEDIIGGLSRSRSLYVIARHSTLPYRDGSADAHQIASELGVRYILDGSVRRPGHAPAHLHRADRRRPEPDDLGRALRRLERRALRLPGPDRHGHRRPRWAPTSRRPRRSRSARSRPRASTLTTACCAPFRCSIRSTTTISSRRARSSIAPSSSTTPMHRPTRTRRGGSTC